MKEYHLTKVCRACGNEYQIELTKYEAAFDPLSSKKMRYTECPVCKSEEYERAFAPMPPIDEDTMQKWASDANLYFLQQDEDMILSEIKYIDIIHSFIQKSDNDILQKKRKILISALCITVHDKRDGYKHALEILLKYKQLLEEARTYIDDYIGRKVYPLLGMKWYDHD